MKLAAGMMVLATMAQLHSAGYGAVLRAHEDNELNHLGFILHKVVFFGMIVACLKLGYGLVGFVASHLIANALLWVLNHFIVTKLYVRIRLVAAPAMWKRFVVTAIPMGGGVMLRQLGMQGDILVLTWLTNYATVGLFSGPYRLVMSLRIVEQVISVPLYPMFSRLAQESLGKVADAYGRAIRVFLLLSCPTAIAAAVWSPWLTAHVLGEKFLPAVSSMQVLTIGLIPMFAATLFPYLYAALDRQKRFLVTMTIGASLRIALAFALIPPLGMFGAAVAFVVSEVILVLIWFVDVRNLGIRPALGSFLWKIALAGGAMALVLAPMSWDSLWWLIPGTVGGGILYLVAIVLLRVFSAEEIRLAGEASRFVRPFIARWTGRRGGRPS
jgi:O-antigen/teichoic acid export membrane protein